MYPKNHERFFAVTIKFLILHGELPFVLQDRQQIGLKSTSLLCFWSDLSLLIFICPHLKSIKNAIKRISKNRWAFDYCLFQCKCRDKEMSYRLEFHPVNNNKLTDGQTYHLTLVRQNVNGYVYSPYFSLSSTSILSMEHSESGGNIGYNFWNQSYCIMHQNSSLFIKD